MRQGNLELEFRGKVSNNSEEVKSKGADSFGENDNDRHFLDQIEDVGKEIQPFPNEKKTDAVMKVANSDTLPMELSISQDHCAIPTRTRQSPGQIWKRVLVQENQLGGLQSLQCLVFPNKKFHQMARISI